jgi:hypothetical protein
MAKKDNPDARNPFDFLFEEISKLMKTVQTKQLIADNEVNLPEDVEKRLDALRKKIDNFVKLSDDIIQLSGVSNEEIMMRLNGQSKEVPEDGKRLIQRSKEIHREVQKMGEQLERKLKDVPISEKKTSAAPEEPPEKTREGKRTSKFKRFGSNKNWKPL